MTALYSLGIIEPGATLEVVSRGHEFLEGPVWDPAGKRLIFSDIPADAMYTWSCVEGTQPFRRPSAMANGSTLDDEGRLITCHHATSCVTRLEHSGTVETLASHYGGQELNSPNDVIVGPDGRIYFSDPTYGRNKYYGVPRQPELDFQGVFALDAATRTLSLLAADFEQPNGLCFTPEGSLLVCDTERAHIRRFNIASDGRAEGGELWAEVAGEGEGAPDGLKCDTEGRVYCAGPGGVHVFDSGARLLGVIGLPEVCANFAWGGDAMEDMYFAASTTLYCLPARVPRGT